VSDRYLRYERQPLDQDAKHEADEVAAIAAGLDRFLDERSADIDAAHVFSAGSKLIQNVVAEYLEPLGFESEYRVSGPGMYAGGARADFYGRLSEGRGVLVEVERGGVHTNNHDLKDLWKAHLSPEVQHLFLIVPMANWRTDGTARERPFQRMPSRFQAFFSDPDRWVDLVSLHVFGYGPSSLGDIKILEPTPVV
jgi:hypothetical protein